MYSLGNILIQDAAAEFIFNCVPAVFTAIRLVGEAGEVVCLEASLGVHGEGVGVVIRAPRCGRRAREVYHKLRARRQGVGRLIEVYRMCSSRPFKALFRTVRTRPSMAPESTLPDNPRLLKWRSMSLLLTPLMMPTSTLPPFTLLSTTSSCP